MFWGQDGARVSPTTLRLMHGDCRDLMAQLGPGSVDAVVCDPPYGLKFMGKGWDHGIPGVEFWRAALRVAKPGAHLLAFGGTRTFHRLTCAIEDAGWEIRDCLSWLYGSGFPKSLDVSKAIDKAAGAETIVGTKPDRWTGKGNALNFSTDRPQAECKVTEPSTDAAKQWQGWGTALKPAWEPIVLARKPLTGTVAANVQQRGTGALNIDGCRIEGPQGDGVWGTSNATVDPTRKFNASPEGAAYRSARHDAGRWPANVVLDEDAARLLDGQSGELSSGDPGIKRTGNTGAAYGKESRDPGSQMGGFGDSGGASRFFYTAKASRSERELGLEGFRRKPLNWSSGEQSPGTFQAPHTDRTSSNHHPTVKPVDLMRWLCRLVTPPGGLVLDPFCGSGSTGMAALEEGFGFIGMDLEAEYLDIAEQRIRATLPLFAVNLQRGVA